MKYLLILMLVLACKSETKNAKSAETTYYLIRHADKDRELETNDPPLNTKGKALAQEWVGILKDKGITEIYSTNYNRTKQTVAPLAEVLNIDLKTYDAQNLYTEDFKIITKGKTVLIVGHSNTIPAIVNKMIGKATYSNLDDANNGTLFKVILSSDGQAKVSVQQFEDGFK